MPGLAQRNDQYSNGSSAIYTLSANGFWSKHRDDVSYNHLQKFWSELSPQARQELLRIDKQTLFEQARKNMYCSRCNGLLLEGFLQIVMYGKSLQQEGAGGHLPCNQPEASKNQSDGGSSINNRCQDEIQDPSVHPWGGLTTTREGSLTLMDCYLYSMSLKGLQNVFDSARARERERELLYPDACGGGGRGWISQGIASYGRGHGTRETCALHTARLSCDTLVDFWSALGEETRQSLLRMKEEDFIERLMYRDCRRNVIREFKELKELKRMRREPRCTSWFCVADTAFQYEVSDDSIQADWRQTFADTVGSYHHFEWAVGTSEGKSDILEFENVGMNGSVQVNDLDLGGLGACFITLRAWKLDGRCTELSVKAHALKGQQCVHCRLVVGDGYTTITKGEGIRRFFEHAEEAEEEEDDDSMDKDGNELDGECSRPQKHAKSPELAREFLLDAATVIFKEQVEKAFREGTARQNAHSIFVCLALKLLEERVHVACKEIITLEKQMKLLEEEEKEKREEEERKERRRTKEREKKLRRKERLKGKGKDKEKKSSESNDFPCFPEVSKEDNSEIVDEEQSNHTSSRDSNSESGDTHLMRPESPDTQDETLSNERSTPRMQNYSQNGCEGEIINLKDGTGTFTAEQSKFSRRRLNSRKELQLDMSLKWSDRRRFTIVSESGFVVSKSETRQHGDSFVNSSRGMNGSNRQLRTNSTKSRPKFNEKFHCSNNRMSDRYDFHSCSCNQNNEFRVKVEGHPSVNRIDREAKVVSKSEFVLDTSKQFHRGNKYNQIDYMHESSGRLKSRVISNNANRESLHSMKVWEPMESQKKFLRSSSDSDVTLRSAGSKIEGVVSDNNLIKCQNDHNDGSVKGSSRTDESYQNGRQMEAECPCDPTEVSCNESGIFPIRISDPTLSSITSNSDNCSSCLSEGDSNTTSSNHGNMESSSTADSEDASQQFEARESSGCNQNGFSECCEVGVEKIQNANEVEALESRTSLGSSSNEVGSNVSGNHAMRSHNFDNGLSRASVPSQHQGMLPPAPDQSIQYPIFQAPSTMGYYQHNPVSWTAGPANGLMPFPHPNHYLYAGPIGYGLNDNSHFCMQYGGLQHLPTPLYNPATVPVYHPVAKPKSLNSEGLNQISKPASQGHLNGAIAETVVSAGTNPKTQVSNGEDNLSVKSDMNTSSFSLFHFGGPVALSTGCKPNPVPPKGGSVGDKNSEDHVENDQACIKKETTTMEEYNLFAASNSLRFSFF
ncbi:Protein shisa-5 [Quillaja saponaria]|uniref:Protein shisa-5 n=1 Tax=Quillaja saponaria TaxID=32244 RepID=A0AAD7VDB6_QUISA|nr:Protein shisa-5 [Quillaja saponaria]